ncbi:hypothetical protein [Paraburkholderia saeva]|uniref:hypothetical protein n=1 Tax=Paraburkholderia saeva TaxID=2777537 RepID=UPI001E430DE9|nr:hypothetical protein [Paraburkholderia saeva]
MADTRNAVGKKAEQNHGPHARMTIEVQGQVEREFVHGPLARGPPDAELGAMTIAQFCTRYNIDRKTLYVLRRDGNGPDVLLIGKKVLIPFRSAAEWEARMTVRREPKPTAETI